MKVVYGFVVSLLLLSAVVDAKDWQERMRDLPKMAVEHDSSENEMYRAILEHDKERAMLLQDQLDGHTRRLETHGRSLSAGDHAAIHRTMETIRRQLQTLQDESREDKLEKAYDARHVMANRETLDIDYTKTGI